MIKKSYVLHITMYQIQFPVLQEIIYLCEIFEIYCSLVFKIIVHVYYLFMNNN